MTTLSIGKFRGLQQCSTVRGAFAILALDQRNNLRRMLRPDAPDAVTSAEMAAFKTAIVASVGSAGTALLLDPEFGAAQSIASRALAGATGLLVATEATGYTGDPTAREGRVLPGWSAAKARRMGASAAKLLVYYHPDAPNAAAAQALVRQVAADCAASDIPVFVEPLSYPLDPAKKKLASEELRRVVVQTARQLGPLGVDVLKLEFPVDVAAEPDERAWAEACAELSAASPVPWVLLSAGVDYDTYLRQVAVACRAGASGVAAGRAIWKEATGLAGEARAAFLGAVARERMARLTSLCDALARPWTEFYSAPAVDGDWYKAYGA